MMNFEPWPKITRLKRGIVVTEKIDGTNAQIAISENGDIQAGSRTRWITPEQDNAGFAKWVQANKDELLRLGPGRHFGEWWGKGIQRGYGLGEKRFSLFNTGRWLTNPERPACCGVVPLLYAGEMNTAVIDRIVSELRVNGSTAAPGWKTPEGVVVFHTASSAMSKITLDNDALPKSLVSCT
jgi:hypothetical protein